MVFHPCWQQANASSNELLGNSIGSSTWLSTQGEPEFTSALGGTGAAASEADLQRNAQADVPSVRQNGKHEQEPSMTPEELAFMRSLGWNDAEDHSGGAFFNRSTASSPTKLSLHVPCWQLLNAI